jgi:hypothetical protein
MPAAGLALAYSAMAHLWDVPAGPSLLGCTDLSVCKRIMPAPKAGFASPRGSYRTLLLSASGLGSSFVRGSTMRHFVLGLERPHSQLARHRWCLFLFCSPTWQPLVWPIYLALPLSCQGPHVGNRVGGGSSALGTDPVFVFGGICGRSLASTRVGPFVTNITTPSRGHLVGKSEALNSWCNLD